MRDFYKQIIFNLYIYCGNRQADKMKDEEIESLLDGLCRMSKIYNYIPEDKQREIVLTCLVSDKEYQNINVRLVSKWFDQNGKIFFQQEAHKPKEITAVPVTGEERDKYIQEYLDAISRAETNLSVARAKGGGSRLRENLEGNGIVIPKPTEPSALDDYCKI